MRWKLVERKWNFREGAWHSHNIRAEFRTQKEANRALVEATPKVAFGVSLAVIDGRESRTEGESLG